MSDQRFDTARMGRAVCRPTTVVRADQPRPDSATAPSATGRAGLRGPQRSWVPGMVAAARRFSYLMAPLTGIRVPPSVQADPGEARPQPPFAYAAAARRALPEVTSDAYLAGGPLDEHPRGNGPAAIACVADRLPVYDVPAGVPFAIMSGRPVHLPVIDQQRGWVRLLLPARPNGSSGWLDSERVRIIPPPAATVRPGRASDTCTCATARPDPPLAIHPASTKVVTMTIRPASRSTSRSPRSWPRGRAGAG